MSDRFKVSIRRDQARKIEFWGAADTEKCDMEGGAYLTPRQIASALAGNGVRLYSGDRIELELEEKP